MHAHQRRERTRHQRWLLLAALVLTACGTGFARPHDTDPRERGNAVTHWNRLATEILPVEVGPIIDVRAMAILHAALHDAINGIERRYEPYTADLSAPGASVDAAVARAARDVLMAVAPNQTERVEQMYTAALADVPDGQAEDDGVGRFWRPFTAIRRADEDGNDETKPDPDWLPLLWTPPEVFPPTFLIPPIPDYPSAAATTSAAAAEVLRAHLGNRVPFSVTSTTLPGESRHFRSFTQAAREAGLSRVFGGIHFLHAVKDGWAQGRGIGREVARKLPRAR